MQMSLRSLLLSQQFSQLTTEQLIQIVRMINLRVSLALEVAGDEEDQVEEEVVVTEVVVTKGDREEDLQLEESLEN